MCHALNKQSLIVFVLLIVASGCREDKAPVASSEIPLPPEAANEPLRVRVTGHDFSWCIRYPGPDRRLDTPDDVMTKRHLHLPTWMDVELELCSDDFVYNLYLPAFDLVEMAFPGRPYVVELSTDSVGTSKLLGAQMCGFTHEQLMGDLVVLSRADFRESTRTPVAQ